MDEWKAFTGGKQLQVTGNYSLGFNQKTVLENLGGWIERKLAELEEITHDEESGEEEVGISVPLFALLPC